MRMGTFTAGHGLRNDAGGMPCTWLRHQTDGLLDQLDELMTDITADPDRPDLPKRVSLLTAGFMETRAALAGLLPDAAREQAFDAAEAQAEARGFQRGVTAGKRAAARQASRLVRQISLDWDARGLGQLRGMAGAAAAGTYESQANRRAELDQLGVAAEACGLPVAIPLGRVTFDLSAPAAPDVLGDRVCATRAATAHQHGRGAEVPG
jgi:hypothetical protein